MNDTGRAAAASDVSEQPAGGGGGDGVGLKPFVLTIIAGVASLACYIALARIIVPRMVSAAPTRVGEVFRWLPLPGRDDLFALREASVRPASVAFVVVVAVLFALYALVVVGVRRAGDARTRAAVWAIGAVLLAVQLIAPVMLSEDAFGYAAGGRMLWLNHLPPAGDRPDTLPPDPFVAYQMYGYPGTPYGPLWALGAAGLARLGGDHIGLTVLLFRASSALATLLAAFAIERCLRRVSPAHATQGLALFLLNPLVVIEFAMSGHNDAWMLAPMMAGMALALRGRWPVAVVCLVLAILVKWPALPVAGLCVAAGWWMRKGWGPRLRFAATVATVALVTSLAVVIPYLRLLRAPDTGAGASANAAAAAAAPVTGDTGTLDALRTHLVRQQYTNSVHELLWKRLRGVLGERPEALGDRVEFVGWWITPVGETDLRADADAGARVVERLRPNDVLFVDAPQMSEWVPVYHSATGASGFVHEQSTRVIDEPVNAGASDPALRDKMLPPKQRRAAVRASTIIRAVTLPAYVVVCVIAVMRVRDSRRLFRWSAVVMLAAIWLVAAWFWPWYVAWALAVAALVPDGIAARVAAAMSCTVLMMYALNGGPERLYELRSLIMFIPPLLLWAALAWASRRRGLSGDGAAA